VVKDLTERRLRLAVEDPDAPHNWPRLWFIWRGNALMASAKGHEYFLKHYLGTHHNAVAEDLARDSVHEVEWRDEAPRGKMDLVVDLNFRMDSSALYSDIVLPAASWYEKADLNSTDLHTFIHPLSAAVPPCWESKSDWDIFKAIAARFSELAATHFPEPVGDIVMSPLAHDTPAEMAQPAIRDWARGEVPAVPGKTMPNLRVVKRDYRNVYHQFIAFGPLARANGLGAHGTQYPIEDVYDDALVTLPTVEIDGKKYPSLRQAEHACDVILRFATVTNGELAYRSYKGMEAKVGLPLADLAERHRDVRISYADLQAHPHRFVNSPMWAGLIENGRPYAPFTYNVERRVPWRTLTGRQHFYLDHPGYLQFGEHLPTYKPKPLPVEHADLRFTEAAGPSLMLNYLTPHGKWHIHSTYGDNLAMMTLSRGIEPLWMNDQDAAGLGVRDNDWVEVYNDHGVVVTRAAVSARIPRGLCYIYHSPERTLSTPKSPLRGYRRAGGHNSVNRTRLKPNLMVGGYGQFTYHFNYWGPVGCNRDTSCSSASCRTCGGEHDPRRHHGRPRTDRHGVSPRQVPRLPHLQRGLQERMDRPPGRRVHVVEQRRDEARHRVSHAVGGPGRLRRRVGAAQRRRPPQVHRPGAHRRQHLPQPAHAHARRLLRAVDLRLRAAVRCARRRRSAGRAAGLAGHRQADGAGGRPELGRRPRRLARVRGKRPEPGVGSPRRSGSRCSRSSG
jgi:nitrate reductase / nitrite oxidoreductase, alpha subunit